MYIPYQLGKIKRRSLTDEAYSYLKNRILTSKIQQGDVITEQEIADALHMSRTPVRNALTRLEHENFVTTLNGRGTLVNILSIADMRDIYSVRSVLEALALETAINNIPERCIAETRKIFLDALEAYQKDKQSLSCEEMFQLDDQFHALLIEYTSNQYIQKIMPSLSERIQWRQLQAYIMTDTFAESTRQHLELLDALEQKKLELAKGLIVRHLKWSYQVMFKVYMENRQCGEDNQSMES